MIATTRSEEARVTECHELQASRKKVDDQNEKQKAKKIISCLFVCLHFATDVSKIGKPRIWNRTVTIFGSFGGFLSDLGAFRRLGLLALMMDLIRWLFKSKPLTMRLHHLVGGSTGPRYNLFRFHYQDTKKRNKASQNKTSFIRDKCCHPMLCLSLLEPHFITLSNFFQLQASRND